MPTSHDAGAGIDPAFLALPLSKLSSTALQRARDFEATHADFRVERLRTQRLALRDGSLIDSSEGDDVGFAVRVVIDGTWGFASGVSFTPDEVVRVTEQAVRVAMVAKAITHERIELADEPVYKDATWVSSYDVDPFDVSTADKVELLQQWSHRLLAAAGVDHVSAEAHQVRENKFYADSHGTTTTQQRVRVYPQLEIFGADHDKGILDAMRTIAPPAGRGWEYLTDGGYDWDAELAELPDLLAAKLAAPTVEAGNYDLVVHPSNLWLTIHESIGHATELDRALGYEANYAGTSFATVDKLGSLQYGSEHLNITGDRTVEHGLSSIGYDDDGVQTQSWDIVKDGVLVGYQTDRRMAATDGPRPVDRVRLRGLAGTHPHPADGQRVSGPLPRGRVDRRLDRRGRTRSLRRRGQVLVDRHAEVQLPVHRTALLRDRGRAAHPPGARRGVPGDHDRLLEQHGRGRRRADLGARRRLQLRQGATRPGRAGQPRLPVRAVPLREHPQHHPRGRSVVTPTPQALVEHALEVSTADHSAVIVSQSSTANLRWANNTLTTNGVMTDLSMTVIAVIDGSAGSSVGVLTRTTTTSAQVAALVAEAETAARAAGPADDAGPLIEGSAAPDWSDEPGHTGIDVFGDFSAVLGDALGRARDEQRLLYGYVENDVTTTYLGTSSGVRRRHEQPTSHIGITGKPSDLSTSAWVGQAAERIDEIDVAGLDRELTRRIGWAERRVDLPGGTLRHRPPADGGRRPDDLRVLRLQRTGRLRRADRVQRPVRRDPCRAAGRVARRPAALRPEEHRVSQPPRS